MNIETVNIFVNPIAGRGLGKALAERLARALTVEGYAVKATFDPPESLMADAVAGPMRAAIVIGGDGTIRAVADRLLALRGEMPPLLPVPLGTANLMNRHLRTKWNWSKLEAGVIQAIRRLKIVYLDAGRANGKLFLLLAGVGYDAAVVHELQRIRNGPISMLSYVLPAFKSLRDYSFPSLRVVVDDIEILPMSPAIVFVGNVKEYGVGFPVVPSARSDDGLLDVVVMPVQSHLGLVKLFCEAVVGRHVLGEGVKCLRGKSIRIESNVLTPVQLDGDAEGFTPVDITLLPVQLPFIVIE